MKRIYSAMIAIMATGAFAVAATPITTQPQPPSTQPQLSGQHELQRPGAIMLKKGFIKQGDKIFRVEQVTKATKLEGLQIDDQGHLMKDGKRIELKDGQLVTPDGHVESFEKTGQ